MTVNEAMIKVAEEVAREYGYICVHEPYKHYAMRDKFWGNIAAAVEAKDYNLHITSVKYIRPAFEGENIYRIDIDMHFGKPRLNVRLPDGNSAHLFYKNGLLSETQTFGWLSLTLAAHLQERIDYYMNKE